ncbi:hypothetical protein [Halorussus lipolyticus]|uniref:hypothetical protein n=1 Tax=Halorussus lipolyticus TaxID=3034024 RepID=UPI0023E788F9|nr:hypothetical protein [Halorussus sp. DT80]
MKRSATRRTFLRADVGGVLGGSALVGGASRAVAADTVTLSGTVVAKSGAAVQNDEINTYWDDVNRNVRTDGEGYFEMEVPKNRNYTLSYYKADSWSDLEATKNGAPHIYEFEGTFVGEDDTHIGELVLPEAHIVDLRVLKPDGEPLMGAKPDYRYSGWGANPGRLSLNTDGYAVIDDASFTGLELARFGTVEVEPPAGDEYEDRTYKHQFSIDGPTEVVATVDPEGVEWSVGEAGETTPKGTTAGTTGEQTTRATTSDRTSRSTAGKSTTEPRTTRDDPATTAGRRGTQRGTGQANRTTTQSRRGFFSNGPGESDLEMLNDPFMLTVGGFVLSAVGIVHQLVRGY